MASPDTNRSQQQPTSRKRRHAASNASRAISALIADPFNDEAPDPTPTPPPSNRRIAQGESPYTNNSSFAKSSADGSSPALTESSSTDGDSSDENSGVATAETTTVLSVDPIDQLHPLEPTASNVQTVAAEVGSVEDPIDFIYALEIQPGRNYQPRVVHSEPKYKAWVLQAHQSTGEYRRFIRLDKAVFSYDESLQMCQRLTDALNRWPDMDAISVGEAGILKRRWLPVGRILFRAIQHKVSPHRPIPYHNPTLLSYKPDKGRPTQGADFSFYFIDPITLKDRRVRWCLSRGRIERGPLAPIVPEPDNIIFTSLPPLYPSVTEPLDTGLDGQLMDLSKLVELTDEAGYRHVEQIRKFVVSRWLRTQSPFKLPTQVTTFCQETAKPFLTSCLPWRLERIAIKRTIFPSESLKKDHPDLTFRPIVVKGSDYFWLRPVLQAAGEVWAQTKDPGRMWLALGQAADNTNRQITAGLIPTNLCSCNIQEKAINTHACGFCGVEFLCISLSLDRSSGLRVCKSCRRFGQHVRSTSLVLARYSIHGISHRDFNTDPMAKVTKMEMIDSVTSKLKNEYGTSYTDDYSGYRRTPVQQQRRPDQISVDAIFPLSIGSSGQVLTHGADNIALIPIAINFMKNMQLPIALAKIADYYRWYQSLDITSQEIDQEDLGLRQMKLIADCRRFTYIRCKIPPGNIKRGDLILSPDQLNYFKEEWISGKAHPGSSAKTPQRRYRTGRLTENPRWTMPIRQIKSIVLEIERWTNVSLPRYQGCPFFGHPDCVPTDWRWETCYTMMFNRRQIMQQYCNRRWETADSIETLYLECVFQVCVGQMVILTDDPDFESKVAMKTKYSEFLGLPLDIEHRNPLTFAIAHRIHGRQMRTGWAINSKTLADRDDSINNILIETRSSNFLKHSFAEVDYPMLKQLVADVRMPLRLVDETIFPRPFDPQMETLRFKSGSQSDIDTDDEWDMEDLVMEDGLEGADELDELLESGED
ncbi:hypothetical protein H9Q70_008207 [Fusarium xylarioides]|nr:hypothetical protein H9Q70_008207 [Fusarium xylarioides]